MRTSAEPRDPRTAYPQPPFEDQELMEVPGSSAAMKPVPNYGESSYEGNGRLRGRTALITGSDSGIGRAVALAYAREGANVAISYLCEHEDAQQTERLVSEAGAQAMLVPGDLKDESFCKDLVARTIDQFGNVDVLVNNAAHQEVHDDIEETTTDSFDTILKTNLYATYWMCREAIPKVRPGGCIINTVSIQGFEPSPNLLAYATTKSALIGFTKALAKQAMERGIRVNAVAPGPVWTPLIPATMPREKVKKFGSNTVFGRPAQPAELAPLYVWLASDEASYVTAEVYGATGGRTPL